MKKFLLAALALGALVSCSKDELISESRQAIEFGNAFVDNSTRAAADPSLNETTLTEFNVWGAINDDEGFLPIFTNDEVSGKVGQGEVWNCEKIQYWVEGAKYNFAGLVNAGNVELGEDKLPATVAFELTTGEVDLLYARSATDIVGKATGNDLVEMNFNHLLSKVKFTVNNTSVAASDYSFLVKNIKITGPISGTCTVADKSWTTTNGDFTGFSNISVSGGAASAECDKELLLIPGSVKVSFTVDIIYSGTTIASHNYSTTVNQTLTVGHAYNFVINVSVGQPIQFTVTSAPTWENGNTAPETGDKTYVPLVVE